MKKIMDQVAFTSADLAAVLTRQGQQAEWMRTSIEEQDQKVVEYLDKKWPEIEALANASLAKDKKDGDNTKWLENQIKRMDYQLAMKNNQNEKDQRRLKTAKRSHEVRLKKILYAQRKLELLNNAQQKLEIEAAPAKEVDAEQQLAEMKREVSLLEEELASPASERTPEDLVSDQNTVRDQKEKIVKLEKAFQAKRMAESRNHPIARSILPPPLKKMLPRPFSMDIEIKWADLLDPEYAQGRWPPAVVHDVLPLRAQKESVQFLSAEEYEATIEGEVIGMVNELERKALGDLEPLEPVEEPSGISKYLPTLKNPFKRAEA
jgi:hypothetical protein